MPQHDRRPVRWSSSSHARSEAIVRRRGFGEVVELDVGEEVEIGAIRIRATHADHAPGRGPFSAKTPSLGYVLEGPASVYFAGDTDLFPAMNELAPLDVALLPVAGWGPRSEERR